MVSDHGRVLVTLDVSVGVEPAAFARVWGEDDQAREVGSATVEVAGSAVFVPGVVELVVIPLLVGVGSSGVYDLVKRVVGKVLGGAGDRDVAEVEVAELESASGDRLVVVRARRGR